jgi:hypothetical protein
MASVRVAFALALLAKVAAYSYGMSVVMPLPQIPLCSGKPLCPDLLCACIACVCARAGPGPSCAASLRVGLGAHQATTAARWHRFPSKDCPAPPALHAGPIDRGHCGCGRNGDVCVKAGPAHWRR